MLNSVKFEIYVCGGDLRCFVAGQFCRKFTHFPSVKFLWLKMCACKKKWQIWGMVLQLSLSRQLTIVLVIGITIGHNHHIIIWHLNHKVITTRISPSAIALMMIIVTISTITVIIPAAPGIHIIMRPGRRALGKCLLSTYTAPSETSSE